MRKFFRLLLILVVVLVLLAVAAGFLLTRAGVQKWLVESRLPEGGRLGSVQVTTGRAALGDLILPLEDGTRLALESAEMDYSLAALLFSRTVRVGRLEVAGLRIDLTAAGKGPASEKRDSRESLEGGLDALYDLARADWRVELGELRVAGVVRDPSGRDITIRLQGGGLMPGETGRFELDSQFSGVPVEGLGTAEFSAGAILQLRQRTGGGFDRIEVTAHAAGRDGKGGALLDLDKTLVLEIFPSEERAVFAFDYELDWPHPEVLDPDLAAVGALALKMEGAGEAKGASLKIERLSANGSSRGQPVLEAQLLQPIQIGGVAGLRGELLRLTLSGVPLSWAGPWMPSGLGIEGGPLSADFALIRRKDDTLVLEPRGPVRLGPASLSRDGAPLTRGLQIACFPRIEFAPSGSVLCAVERLQVDGPTGPVFAGSAEAAYEKATGALGAELALEGSLPAVLAQPVVGRSGVLRDGTFKVEADLDTGAERSLRSVVQLGRLRSAATGEALPDLRLAIQADETQAGVWKLMSSFETGADDAKGTRFGAIGEVRTGDPLRFDLDLRGTEVRVEELKRLSGLLEGPEKDARRPAPAAPVDAGPPWAGVRGEFTAQVDRIILPSGGVVSSLQAAGTVDPARVGLDRFRASLGQGEIAGKGGMAYDAVAVRPYALKLDIEAKSIDPSALGLAGRVPVRGRFDGTVRLEGAGRDPAGALDSVRGTISVRGNEGVVTAFELDERGELGVLGAGLIGAALNRPGLTELARVVPYFKEIRFSEFALDLARGNDGRIDLSQLRILGENLLIEGSGNLSADKLSEALTSPLALSLSLASKGRLADSLDFLGLLQPETGEDGFRRWTRQLAIGGTLQDPDTSQIERLLAQAARSALSKPAPAPVEQPAAGGAGTTDPSAAGTQAELDGGQAEPSRPETKTEKRAREIEQTIKVLEDLF